MSHHTKPVSNCTYYTSYRPSMEKQGRAQAGFAIAGTVLVAAAAIAMVVAFTGDFGSLISASNLGGQTAALAIGVGAGVLGLVSLALAFCTCKPNQAMKQAREEAAEIERAAKAEKAKQAEIESLNAEGLAIKSKIDNLKDQEKIKAEKRLQAIGARLEVLDPRT